MPNGNQRPKKPKKKTLWQHRCDLIQSINFDRLAREVDAKRMKEAGGIPIAPDERANGRRMKRVLLALHRRLGKHSQCVLKMERIASDSHYSIRNARRGVDDLDEAHVIDPDRKRKDLRYGGQGPSLYKIVWSTVTDLALTQGLQPSLFDDDGDCDSQPPSAPAPRHSRGPDPAPTARHSRPSGPAAFTLIETEKPFSTPGLFGRALGQVGRALGQVGRALGQVGRAPGQNREPNAHAGASFTSDNTSSPPSPPEQPVSCPAPFTQAADPLPAESKEKKEFIDLATRLEQYGVYYTRPPLKRAFARGWTADQVAAFLARCEAHTIVVAAGPGESMTVYAWPPGLVACHLSTSPPGAQLQVQPDETFVRARRDRELRLAAEREATVREAEAQFAAANDAASVSLRDEAEALLASMPPDEVAELQTLLLERNGGYLRKLVAHRGEGPLRLAMIEELKARVARARSQPEGDG